MNEIFKGMDNASEAINENFEQVKMTEGSTEKASWLIFPNGLKICEGSFTYVPGEENSIDLPIEFTENRYTVDLTASGAYAAQMNAVWKLIPGRRPNSIRVYGSPYESPITLDPFEVTYTAIGR